MAKSTVKHVRERKRRARLPRLGRSLPAAALTYLTLLQLLASPASAYVFNGGGFTSGADSAALLFDGVTTEQTGPSVRLLTNGSVTSGSIYVAGSAGFLNTSTVETTSTDFASNTAADNVVINTGTLFLGNDSASGTLSAANAFRNATLSGTKIDGDSLVLDATTSGTFTSEAIPAPLAGWGNLLAWANLSGGGSIAFSILSSNGSVIVASQAPGATVDIDPVGYASIRVRGTLSASSPALTPRLRQVTLGQSAGDTMLGSGVSRTVTNVSGSDSNWTTRGSPISFVENATSPYITTAASTYYSSRVEDTSFLQVNGTWHMFATVANSSTRKIGHATSTDLSSWTWDPSPALSPAASGFDSNSVDHPWVIANGTGSGYLMYYSGWKSGTQMQTGLATSSDLVNWTKYGTNPVIAAGAGWDSWNTGQPVAMYDNGTFKLWYAGASVTTGGGNSLGYATSSDGFSWTKYGTSAVLARGASGIDQSDLQLKALRQYNGVYHAYFACNSPSTSYRVCYASSSDGISWTKWGSALVTPTGAGWESGNVWPGDLIAAGNRYIFMYGGCNAACTTTATGRADSNFEPGTVRASVDFGARVPARLDTLSFQASAGTGASAQILLRSSTDGSTWSAYENLTASSTISSTPARRYVEWLVFLNASSTANAPVYTATVLNYTAFDAQGRYQSSVFNFPDQISGAKVTLAFLNASGQVSIDVSNNNGTTWTRLVNNTSTALALAGQGLMYALTLEGGPTTTPVIDSVTLTVEQRGFPANVTVRFGASGSRVVNVSGPFVGGVNVSLPVSELNALVAAYLVSNPGATYLDVPIMVGSTHFGTVEVREPRVNTALKNPLFTSFTPNVGSQRVNENATITLSVTASTYPVGIPVNTSWFLDGVLQGSAANLATFAWTPDFFSAGNHTVRVFVENGDFFVNNTWTVFVDNVNRLPVFTNVQPATPLSVSHTATTAFQGDASDLDLETLAYSWRLDGRPLPDTTPWVNVSNLSLGAHILNLTVRDPFAAISTVWVITSTNADPVVSVATPASPFSMSHTAVQTLSVTAMDPDGDPLTFAWLVDGAPFAVNASALDVGPLAVGAHLASVSVRDPWAVQGTQWTLLVTNDAPVLATADPSADFTLSHRASQTVHVVVGDGDGDVLRYNWTLDGAVQASTTDTLQLANLPVGAHRLSVTVSDPYTTTTFVWNVTSTNAAPVISVVSAPPSGASRSHTTAVDLQLAVSDADGDALFMSWSVNGGPAANGVPNLTLSPVGVGQVLVAFGVSDLMASAQWLWNTTGTNAAPDIVSTTPGDHASVSIVDAVDFVLVVDDVDGDVLTYAWFLDAAAAGANAPDFSPSPFGLGAHTVRVTVSDGLAQSEFFFTVTASDMAPEITSASPEFDITASHTARIRASVVASDREGATLRYKWTLGSLELASNTGAVDLDPIPAGTYTLAVQVSDALSTVRREWTVTVTDSPFTLEGVAPAPGPLAASTFEDVVFTARGVDPDGDPVVLQWFDGNNALAGTTSATARFEAPGVHAISLVATSTGFRISLNWTLTVTAQNVAPAIASALPGRADVVVVVGEGAAFAVSVTDDGTLPLDIAWKLDGVVVAHGSGYVYTPQGGAIGHHTIEAVADDGQFNATQSWSVEVAATSPVKDTGGSSGVTMILVVGLGIAAVAAFVVGRRKGRAEETFKPASEDAPGKPR